MNEIPGLGNHWVKLKGDQGWKNTRDGTIWKRDKLRSDHWDVMNRKGKKIKEIVFMVNKFDLMERKTRTKNLKVKTPYQQYQKNEKLSLIYYQS